MKLWIKVITCFFIHCNVAFAQTNEKKNDSIQINIAHSDKANSIKGKSAIRFKEILEAKFHNKIKVNIFDNGIEFKESEQLEAVELGLVNIVITSGEQASKNYNLKQMQLFNLPFLFDSNNELIKILHGKTGLMLKESINNKLNASYMLGYWVDSKRNFAGNEIYEQPNKFKNKTFLTTASYNNDMIYASLGATLINNTLNKNNQSFLTTNKKIDAVEISNFHYENFNFKDKFRIITETNHAYNVNVVISNKKWLNSLPIEVKDGLLDVIKTTTDYSIEAMEKDNIVVKDNLIKSGVKVMTLSNEQRSLLKKIIVSNHSNYMNENKNILLLANQEIKSNNQFKGK